MAGPPPTQVPKERKLPPLRKNLQFLRGAPTSEGVPTWTVVDPVRNKYFQIEWNVYQLLQRWPCGTIEKLAEEIAHNTTIPHWDGRCGRPRQISLCEQPDRAVCGRGDQRLRPTRGGTPSGLVAMVAAPLPLHQASARAPASVSPRHVATGGAVLYGGGGGLALRHDRGRGAVPRGSAVGHVCLDVPPFLQLARSRHVWCGSLPCEGRARTRPCLHSHPVRVPRADHRCGLYGHDAGALFRRQRFVSTEFQA